MKRASMALFFFFIACSSDCSLWQHDIVRTKCSKYDSDRIILRPNNIFRGLELELARTCSGDRMYVNVFSLSLPRDPDHPSKTKITIITEDEEYHVLADRLEGGQRLLLPGTTADFIIQKLLEDQAICISIGRYRSEIYPNDFREAYILNESDLY